ncbi:MAG: prepilin-type N-terminal cleavage/methylation domain-containing protein [Planctomycetaceae bacterium]
MRNRSHHRARRSSERVTSYELRVTSYEKSAPVPTRHSSLVTRHSPRQRRRGFTLVEMMVSVALVLLLMLMLATVFSLATASIGDQKGIGQNDQKMRLLTTILRDDLSVRDDGISGRTFKYVVPFEPGDVAADHEDTPLAFNQREGYFYISENDPDDDTDDVLRFTVRFADGDVHYGRAVPLGDPATLDQNRNQPDWDDGAVGNEQMTSPMAEIVYFLRRGTLYRRVMLIRKPLDSTLPDPQPKDSNGEEYFNPVHPTPYPPPPPPAPGGVFWRDFDLSAYRNGPHPGAWAHVHGPQSLSNDPAVAPLVSLGKPNYRFGFHHPELTAPRSGMPREYVTDASGNPYFIGTFTHEETSSNAFVYPQVRNAAHPNPMSTTLTAGDDGVVTQYAGGTRRAEDILMTRVHAFDVKVWDDAANPPVGAFVDIGGAAAVDYAPGNNRNTAYGPGGPAGNNIYDTWHPAVALDGGNLLPDNSDGDVAPYRPLDPNTNEPRPLRAIQITIRFHDLTSDQLRQMTLVQSLVN